MGAIDVNGLSCRTPDGVDLLRDVIGLDRFVGFDRQARVIEHLEPVFA